MQKKKKLHLSLHTCVEHYSHHRTCKPGVDGRLLAVLSVMSTHAAVIAGHVVILLHVVSTRHQADWWKDRRVKATEGRHLSQVVARLRCHHVIRVSVQERCRRTTVGVEGQRRPVILMTLGREAVA